MDQLIYRREAMKELQSILMYWMEYMPDETRGGFIGRIDEYNVRDLDAPKGLVLNSRILWAFSTAYRHTDQWIYRTVADRAYEYMLHRFWDNEYGGAFWSLDASGEMLDSRKQIYGLAFALYGLCAYHQAFANSWALGLAVSLYEEIERNSRDMHRGGYFEAFERDWQPLDDLRLSKKDLNTEKTTNTHLHILEAYAALYRIWPDVSLGERIEQILRIFCDHLIDKETGHLRLFFDKDWNSRSCLISYGHDIEAAWLLYDAALAIKNPEWIKKTTDFCLLMTRAASRGLDKDGGLWYEKENGQLIKEKHWWPQAEAMVGFLYAWKLSGEPVWYQASVDTWTFVKEHIRDPSGLEWYWGVDAGHRVLKGQDKAGFWKCPYHNSRACIQIMDILA